MKLIQSMRFQIALPFIFVGGLPISLLIAVSFIAFLPDQVRDHPVLFPLVAALVSVAFFCLLLFFGHNFVPRRFVAAKLQQETQRLESIINNNSAWREREVRECEARVQKAQAELTLLPARQAEKIQSYQRKLAEVQETLMQL